MDFLDYLAQKLSESDSIEIEVDDVENLEDMDRESFMERSK